MIFKGYLYASVMIVRTDDSWVAIEAWSDHPFLALFGTTCCQYRFLQADIHSLSLRRSGHSISLQNSRSL